MLIKELDINLRLSLNMTNDFDKYYDHTFMVDKIFTKAKELGADQITFRKLYTSNNNTEQDKWIDEHSVNEVFWAYVEKYIKDEGKKLERLPFGAYRYSVNEISTVIDDDCMSTEIKQDLKYLILRENNKLYTKWDDKGSLLF